MRIALMIAALMALAVPAYAQTPTVRRIAIALVNFTHDTRTPWTLTEAQTFGETALRAEIEANSYGTETVEITTMGYFTVAVADPCVNYPEVRSATLAAAEAAGTPLSTTLYDNRVLLYPGQPCGWIGNAVVGGRDVWANGAMSAWVITHELGHCDGLLHAHATACSSTGCTTSDTGDEFSLMGYSGHAQLSAHEKVRVGWLNTPATPPVQTVTVSGQYWIGPTDAPADGQPKAVRVRGPDIVIPISPPLVFQQWLYIETRQSPTWHRVVLRTVQANDVYQEDVLPDSPDWLGQLGVGQRFTVPDTRFVTQSGQSVTVQPLSYGQTGALIDVQVSADTTLSAPTNHVRN